MACDYARSLFKSLETRKEEQSARFYRELPGTLKKMDGELETEGEKLRVRDVFQGVDKDSQGRSIDIDGEANP
jgi:hypothetical protein